MTKCAHLQDSAGSSKDQMKAGFQEIRRRHLTVSGRRKKDSIKSWDQGASETILDSNYREKSNHLGRVNCEKQNYWVNYRARISTEQLTTESMTASTHRQEGKVLQGQEVSRKTETSFLKGSNMIKVTLFDRQKRVLQDHFQTYHTHLEVQQLG